MVGHHSANLVDQKHCGTGDPMDFICYLISKDHVVKR